MDGVLQVIDMLGRTIMDLREQLERERVRNEMLVKQLQEQREPQVGAGRTTT